MRHIWCVSHEINMRAAPAGSPRGVGHVGAERAHDIGTRDPGNSGRVQVTVHHCPDRTQVCLHTSIDSRTGGSGERHPHICGCPQTLEHAGVQRRLPFKHEGREIQRGNTCPYPRQRCGVYQQPHSKGHVLCLTVRHQVLTWWGGGQHTGTSTTCVGLSGKGEEGPRIPCGDQVKGSGGITQK